MKLNTQDKEKLRKNLIRRIKRLLNNLGDGDISPSAYDTAWVARIPDKKDPTKPMFPQCLKWVQDHQLKDGSWGAPNIEYYHDRIVCTLSCIIALKTWNVSPKRIERGEEYINRNLENLRKDHHETIGFELLFPSLFEKAKKLNLKLSYSSVIEDYIKMRDQKLKIISIDSIYKYKSTLSHSIEFLDGQNINFDKVFIQQYVNGSFGNSPSATSFVVMNTYNDKAVQYLKKIMKEFKNGGVPGIYPFEIFEKAWMLDNVKQAKIDLSREENVILKYLYRNWNNEKGISIASTFQETDLDDTGMVLKLLKQGGFNIDEKVFNFFKKDDYYVCYQFQLNPSISAYIHFLAGATQIYKENNKLIKHIISFLKDKQSSEGYLLDKWQISPYYSTSHLITELVDLHEDQLLDKAVNWILRTQNDNGSWGYLNITTLEETAYALQALLNYSQNFGGKYQNEIDNGIQFLLSNLKKPKYLSLWIDKGLYAPYSVIKSLILSVILMYYKI